MKKLINKSLLCVMAIACTMLFTGCAQILSQIPDTEPASANNTGTNSEVNSETNSEINTETGSDGVVTESTSLITTYNWQGSEDGSLLVCNSDGTFHYYQTAEDLTDNYYEGTYLFAIGQEAVTYITTTLSDYGVTKEELETIFANNEEYDESNFVCLVLNNDACIIDGVNQLETSSITPYMGFCLVDGETYYLDIANMNSANYHLFISVPQ